MIEVVFVLQEPGNHHEIDRRVMPFAPRTGEMVGIDGRDDNVSPSRLHVVHEVMYLLGPSDVVAWVYLR